MVQSVEHLLYTRESLTYKDEKVAMLNADALINVLDVCNHKE